MKKTLMFLALALLASPAMAQYRSSGTDDAARGSLIDLSVVDRQSSYPLPVYRAQGLQFIEGTPGQAYSVRLTNKTPERLLVVLAVDGINAVSGKTAAYNQTGYVLEPYDQVEVSGWRQSMQSVAQFVFTTPSRSYAARTDRPWQVGVIGAAVFREDRARPVIAPAPPFPIDLQLPLQQDPLKLKVLAGWVQDMVSLSGLRQPLPVSFVAHQPQQNWFD